MVRTPRMRGRASRKPNTIDGGPENVSRVVDPAAAPAEAEFAASEALTPGEDASGPATAAETSAERPAGGGQDVAGEIPSPETAAAIDSFRFSSALPAPPANDPLAAEPRADADRPAAGEADASTAAEPADAPAAPGPFEPASDAFEPSRTGAVPPLAAALPRERRGPGAGSLFAAALLGGAAALLLAGLFAYSGLLPGFAPRNDNAAQALQSEVAGLKKEMAALRDAAAAAPDQSVSSALDTLRGDVAQLKEGAGSGTDAPELQTRLGAVEQKVDALNGDTALADQVTTLGQRVATAEALARAGSEGAADRDKRLAALEQSVGGLAGRVEALGQQPKIALAIAASALKAASDRGAPFKAELETLKAIAPGLAETKDLQPFAEAGVPTRAALLSDWNAASAAILATERPADPEAGFMDRLLSSAEGLVSVRPIGAVQGTSVSAVVARMEVAMNAGNLEQAITEYDALPDAAKQAGAPLAEKIRARIAVERLIDGAIANAMKAA